MARVEHTNPDDRTTRTRARTKAERVLSHGPCREARRWGGRARSGDGKTQRRSTREAGQRGSEGESRARTFDEEDIRDRVTGEGMGCGRESDFVPGSPGRGGFDKWGRLVGGVCVRRHMVSVWVPRGRERQPFGARGSGPAQRRAGTRKAGAPRSPSPFSPPRAQLSTRRRRETRGGRGEGWREAESGAVGVRNGFLARGSRSEARGRRSGAARQRWRIRSSALPKLPAHYPYVLWTSSVPTNF